MEICSSFLLKGGIFNERLLLYCLDPSPEQEEPDSAFEATQYFFEDITPECTHGRHLLSRAGKDEVTYFKQHVFLGSCFFIGLNFVN